MTPAALSARNAPLASDSLAEHLLRGVVGLILGVLAIVLVRVTGPVSLLLLILTAVAWRGCPSCWTVGLIGTLADTRERHGCSRCSEGGLGRGAPSARD